MKYPDNIENAIKSFCARKRAVVKTTTELDRRIIDEALLAQKKSEKTQSAATQSNIWRIIMKSRITKLAAAAVIIIALMLGINYLGTPIDGASTVFAAAMDSVRHAGTFSCTQISESVYQDGEESRAFLLKQRWMFKEPDRERHEKLTSPWPQYIGEVTIMDYDTREQLVLRPVEKTATLLDMSSDYDIDDKTGELKVTQLSTCLRDYLLELSAGAIEDLGSVELDGRSVRLMRSHKDKRITTVWINPETNYPVQIEHKWTDKSRSPVIYTSIQIDTELDDTLFSLEPPEGYTLSVDEPVPPEDKKKMMTKMKYLGLWCLNYASDNNDQFPSELEDLVTAGAITDEVLRTILAAPDEPDGPPVIRYRLPRTGTNPSSEVILYEIYRQWSEDGVAVCFADGHSELIGDQNRFEELIK
ncbi:MAG: hypothetical protein ACYS80_04955 [Planctomycetota bacterium]|jgi:outer membrane lipoprotein-sorting protein